MNTSAISLSKEEFQKRLAHNTKTFLKQQEKNKFTPSAYYFWDKKPREMSTLQYLRKGSDIFSATIIGALPASNMYGEDAYIMRAGKIIKIELKSAYVNHKALWRTKNGTIYVGNTNAMITIENYFKARYTNNSYDPEIDSYLVCCDTSGKWNTEVIGVWKIDGRMGHTLLNEHSTKQITLRKFIKNGEKLDGRHLNVPIIGWEKYKKTLQQRLPVKKCRQI
jgi:hypothetical protein